MGTNLPRNECTRKQSLTFWSSIRAKTQNLIRHKAKKSAMSQSSRRIYRVFKTRVQSWGEREDHGVERVCVENHCREETTIDFLKGLPNKLKKKN